jgi:spore coat polysaccharide biosynthesis protein SpsF
VAKLLNTVSIIQARMGSTRLPRKVLADIVGTPLIIRIIERVRAARGIEELVVATTTDREDDELAGFLLQGMYCKVFRGMRDDVLDRFYRCATTHAADIIVRVTADDPLKDPRIIERATQMLIDDPSLDYCSNTLEPTFPEGLDIEVFRFSALEKAWRQASLPSEREHVTPYIWKHPEIFRLANFRHERDLSSWRWTVDKPNDLEFMRAVYGHFASQPLVSFQDVIAWLHENPSMLTINSDTQRNEGYLMSLESEQKQ